MAALVCGTPEVVCGTPEVVCGTPEVVCGTPELDHGPLWVFWCHSAQTE